MKQDIQNGMKLVSVNVNYMQVFVMMKNVDKLVEKCCENIDESEVICATPNSYENICGSCLVYIVLLVIFFIISISISGIICFCSVFIFIGT